MPSSGSRRARSSAATRWSRRAPRIPTARRAACGRSCLGDADYLPIYGGEAVRLDGAVIGRLRSVAYGPTVERTIAYAYLPAAIAEGEDLEVDVFDRRVAAVVAPTSSSIRPALRMRG